jgi:ribosomal protein S27E
MSLRCPRCNQPLPRGRVLWFTRLFSFNCAQCGTQLALTWTGRAILTGSIVAAILLYLLVKHLTASATLAAAAFVAGVAGGQALTWRIGELGVFMDGSEGQKR